MRTYALIVFILFLFEETKTFAQTSPGCGLETNATIKTYNPLSYVNIPNTNLFIIPPVGFKIANSFSGFERDQSTKMIVLELHDADQISKLPTMDRPIASADAPQILDFKKIKVNNYPGAYIAFLKDSMYAYEITFGNNDFRVLITTVGSKNDKNLEDLVIAAYNTLYFDKK